MLFAPRSPSFFNSWLADQASPSAREMPSRRITVAPPPDHLATMATIGWATSTGLRAIDERELSQARISAAERIADYRQSILVPIQRGINIEGALCYIGEQMAEDSYLIHNIPTLVPTLSHIHTHLANIDSRYLTIFGGLGANVLLTFTDLSKTKRDIHLAHEIGTNRKSILATRKATDALDAIVAVLSETSGETFPPRERLNGLFRVFLQNWNNINPTFRELLSPEIISFSKRLREFTESTESPDDLLRAIRSDASDIAEQWRTNVRPSLDGLHQVRQILKGNLFCALMDVVSDGGSCATNASFSLLGILKALGIHTASSAGTPAIIPFFVSSIFMTSNGALATVIGLKSAAMAYRNAYYLGRSLNTLHKLRSYLEQQEQTEVGPEARQRRASTPLMEIIRGELKLFAKATCKRIVSLSFPRAFWFLFGLGVFSACAGGILFTLGGFGVINLSIGLFAWAACKFSIGFLAIAGTGIITVAPTLYLRNMHRRYYQPTVEEICQQILKASIANWQRPETLRGRLAVFPFSRKEDYDADALAAKLKDAIRHDRYSGPEHPDASALLQMLSEQDNGPSSDTTPTQQLQEKLISVAVHFLRTKPRFMAIQLLKYLQIEGNLPGNRLKYSQTQTGQFLCEGLNIEAESVDMIGEVYRRTNQLTKDLIQQLREISPTAAVTPEAANSRRQLFQSIAAYEAVAQANLPGSLPPPITLPANWQQTMPAPWQGILARLQLSERIRCNVEQAFLTLIADRI